MSSRRLVSVLIPCFNAGEYLSRAVRSALAQGLTDTEIIIVDDQSTDDSRSIAESLAGQYAGVRLLRQVVNSGPATARNTGLRAAVGRYVCFLDADDEYAPGFFSRAVSLLEANDRLAAITTGIELVNCQREVHPVQMHAIVGSLASNLLVRKVVADLLGGFPENDAFRGSAAGEDHAFRVALATWFNVAQLPEKFLRYLTKPGDHLHYFLDRSKVVDGKVVFSRRSSEEESGNRDAAWQLYTDRVRQRISMLGSLRNPVGAAPSLMNHLFQAVANFDRLRTAFEGIEGFLDPREGFALYHVASAGPGRGAIVEIGSLLGRSTCWLASGSRDAGRRRVVAVQTRSVLPTFIANLERLGLRAMVEIRVGSSLEVGSGWREPIRLLFVAGEDSYEGTRNDVETWAKHVVPGGIMAFHDIDVSPGVTRFYGEFRRSDQSWKDVGSILSLRLMQRVYG